MINVNVAWPSSSTSYHNFSTIFRLIERRKRAEGSNDSANHTERWRKLWMAFNEVMKNWKTFGTLPAFSPKTCFSYRANGFGDKILMKKVEEQASFPKKTPRSALCVLIFYETLIFYLSLVITRKINIWWIQELESMNESTPFVFFVFRFRGILWSALSPRKQD